MEARTSVARPPNPESKSRLPVLLFLLLALVFLALGFYWGENQLVQANAHYLCLDCMGIG